MVIKNSIFKAYDIRGTYPDQLDEEIAYKVGQALVDFLKAKKIIVARDMRSSSPDLAKKFIQGALEQGADVIDLGLAATPMFYFAVAHLQSDGGAMITASHNPKEYNGLKMTARLAQPIGKSSGMDDIKNKVIENAFELAPTKGKIERYDIKNEFLKHAFSVVDKTKITPKKIAVDTANGMGAVFIKDLLEKIGCEVLPMYFELDGTFPNHEADPLKSENLKDLQEKVKKENCDLGIAIDGDADRVFFVDEKAEIVPSDFVTALISQEIIKRFNGAKILYDLRSSRIILEKVAEIGGEAIECKVGHANIKKQMREEKAVFAGELSGHYYYAFTNDEGETYYIESPEVLILELLKVISVSKKPLSEVLASLKKYFHSGEINFEVSDIDKKLKKLEERYSDGKIEHLDGLSVKYDDWWFNVRPSNTEPVLRLNLEANTKEQMVAKRDELEELIRK